MGKSNFGLTVNSQLEENSIGKEKGEVVKKRLRQATEYMIKHINSFCTMPEEGAKITDVKCKSVTPTGRQQSKIHCHTLLQIEHTSKKFRLDYRKIKAIYIRFLQVDNLHFDCKVLRTPMDVSGWLNYMQHQ